MNDLLKKITEAKAKFLQTEDQNVISSWEAEAKRHLMTVSLKGHKGIELILENYKKDIADMNEVLLTDRALTESDRVRLLDRREMYEKFIRIFDDAEKGLEKIEKEVEENIA